MVDRKSIQGFEYLFFMEEKTMKKFVSIISLVLVAAMLCVSLVSCGGPAKDPADAKAALEENGYLVVKVDTAILLPEDVEATVLGTTDENYILITYYETSDAAEAAWEKAQEEAKELEDEYENVVCKKSGKMIYIGTEQAVKDAK